MREHPTVAANRAHREDLVWVKIGRSEYMRADGVTIRKVPGMSAAWWQVLLPSGERAQLPIDGRFSPFTPAAAPSLTYAKMLAENVTADSPAYEATR